MQPTDNNLIRNEIKKLIQSIEPYDAIEQKHKAQILNWITSGDPLFRFEKPDKPLKHLVSYFSLFDEASGKILLVNHINAQLWLTAGGHVEQDEHPKITVERECFEELGIKAEFWFPEPLFVTTTKTVGFTAGHIDIGIWYLLRGNEYNKLTFDQSEFTSVAWFDFEKIPFEKADPNIKRFLSKLKNMLKIENLVKKRFL